MLKHILDIFQLAFHFNFCYWWWHLIRADGSPKYTMICNLSGAVINTILDPIFIFGFNMGMAEQDYLQL